MDDCELGMKWHAMTFVIADSDNIICCKNRYCTPYMERRFGMYIHTHIRCNHTSPQRILLPHLILFLISFKSHAHSTPFPHPPPNPFRPITLLHLSCLVLSCLSSLSCLASPSVPAADPPPRVCLENRVSGPDPWNNYIPSACSVRILFLTHLDTSLRLHVAMQRKRVGHLEPTSLLLVMGEEIGSERKSQQGSCYVSMSVVPACSSFYNMCQHWLRNTSSIDLLVPEIASLEKRSFADFA